MHQITHQNRTFSLKNILRYKSFIFHFKEEQTINIKICKKTELILKNILTRVVLRNKDSKVTKKAANLSLQMFITRYLIIYFLSLKQYRRDEIISNISIFENISWEKFDLETSRD